MYLTRDLHEDTLFERRETFDDEPSSVFNFTY